ncbi:MAG: NADH-quinone oxidoreductase subunit A [Candidatus Caldarchaeum sp.]|uniref:NADH-quinone oxidoreductase subunit A n=1 Tax=Caldiarchaeum subterraneum TaxID=311458 RepID=A0A7J3VU80_CALS0
MSQTEALIYYTVLTAALPLILILANKLLSSGRRTRRKRLSFESGQVPFEWAETSFPVEYFPYAIIYVAYAVLSIAVFVSALAIIDNPQYALNLVLLLGVLSASSIFAALSLKDLPQRL